MIRINKTGYHGITLPDYGIGLDIPRPEWTSHTFISHAHADHIPRDRNMEVYATQPTAAFMRQRGFVGTVQTLPFGEAVDLEKSEARVTLYPAGHILGSAMVFIETPEGNLLYTGDFKTPPSPTTEGFELPQAPVHQFITEATFGLPIYKWESTDQLFEEIRQFASGALKEGSTPVFMAYNLGKAQEVMHALAPLKHPMQIHGSGYPLCQIYEEYGYDLGNYEKYKRETAEGNILITPSSGISTGVASNIPNKRMAYCSGWATLESRRTQLTVDSLIPLSDHIDFFQLIELCDQLKPEVVYLTHTPNPDVVIHYLSQRGIEAQPLDMEVVADD